MAARLSVFPLSTMSSPGVVARVAVAVAVAADAAVVVAVAADGALLGEGSQCQPSHNTRPNYLPS